METKGGFREVSRCVCVCIELSYTGGGESSRSDPYYTSSLPKQQNRRVVWFRDEGKERQAKQETVVGEDAYRQNMVFFLDNRQYTGDRKGEHITSF